MVSVLQPQPQPPFLFPMPITTRPDPAPGNSPFNTIFWSLSAYIKLVTQKQTILQRVCIVGMEEKRDLGVTPIFLLQKAPFLHRVVGVTVLGFAGTCVCVSALRADSML